MTPLPAPEVVTSRHRLRVRFCETDLMGIVHHANYLVYCEAARVEWLLLRGVSYESWTRHGLHLPVVDATLRYKLPARFEDELEVVTTVVELSRVAVRFRYRVMRKATLLCEAETRLACVGDDLRLKRIPAEVERIFTSGELASAAPRAAGA
ncbi:MAG: YbgC/FadM family acyl-CoA thioesterase [Myxococcales bacterium]|nr:YbgC/FadM family acyl-CoA thioesterase [Myxococcales bacterium]